MNKTAVQVARVYLVEGRHQLDPVIRFLEHDAKVRGLTVYRGIAGYGASGEHKASLLDLSLDLPLVVEFFETASRVDEALEGLARLVTPGHILTWPAEVNAGDD
jgi:PII-like signaling protein